MTREKEILNKQKQIIKSCKSIYKHNIANIKNKEEWMHNYYSNRLAVLELNNDFYREILNKQEIEDE